MPATSTTKTKSTMLNDSQTHTHTATLDENVNAPNSSNSERNKTLQMTKRYTKTVTMAKPCMSKSFKNTAKSKSKICNSKDLCDIEDLDACLHTLYKEPEFEPKTPKRPKRNVKAPSKLTL